MPIYFGEDKVHSVYFDYGDQQSDLLPWVKPAAWPDIQQILEDDVPPAGYMKTGISLMYFDPNSTLREKYVRLFNMGAYRTSEGKQATGLAYKTQYYYQFNSGGWQYIIHYTATSMGKHYYKIPIQDYIVQRDGNAHNALKWIHFNDCEVHSTSIGCFGGCTGLDAITGMKGFFEESLNTKAGTGHGTFAMNTNRNKIIEGHPTVEFASTQGHYTFYGCTSLKHIYGTFLTQKVTNATHFFQDCTKLEEITNEIYFNNLTATDDMFNNCVTITRVPETFGNKIQTASNMFNDCVSLEKIPSTLSPINLLSAANMFTHCVQITEVPSTFSMPKCKDATSMFEGCFNLESTADEFTTNSLQNGSKMFAGCGNLRTVGQGFCLSAATNVDDMFQYCAKLYTLPDVLDLRKVVGSLSSFFQYMTSLHNIPTTLLANDNIDISYCLDIDPERFAKFENDVIVDGLVYNINTVAATKTFKINSGLKSKYTAAQWTAITQMMTSKKWTIGV